MAGWIENGSKGSFSGVPLLALGLAAGEYLLVAIPAGVGFISGLRMHVNSWGDSYNFPSGSPQASPERQGLHGISMAAYTKSTTSEQPGVLLYQTGWINPPITGEYEFTFSAKQVGGLKAFVAWNRVGAHLTHVDDVTLDMLSDRLQGGPELTQGGWSAAPTILAQWPKDASGESLSFFANPDVWVSLYWSATLADSLGGGKIDPPETSGLYTAFDNFSVASPDIKKLQQVRKVDHLVPVQKNFAVSKTDEHVYIASQGAGAEVIGRFSPPYTGPEDELFTPTASDLLDNPAVLDENISGSLDISTGVDGLDLTDAV